MLFHWYPKSCKSWKTINSLTDPLEILNIKLFKELYQLDKNRKNLIEIRNRKLESEKDNPLISLSLICIGDSSIGKTR